MVATTPHLTMADFQPDQKSIDALGPPNGQKRRLLSGSEPSSTDIKSMSDNLFMNSIVKHIKDTHSNFCCDIGLHESSMGPHTSIRISGSVNLFNSVSAKSSPGPAMTKSGIIPGSGIIIHVYFNLCTIDISAENLIAYIDFAKKKINIMRVGVSKASGPESCTFNLTDWKTKIDEILGECIQWSQQSWKTSPAPQMDQTNKKKTFLSPSTSPSTSTGPTDQGLKSLTGTK
jgi:hypothetical protein